MSFVQNPPDLLIRKEPPAAGFAHMLTLLVLGEEHDPVYRSRVVHPALISAGSTTSSRITPCNSRLPWTCCQGYYKYHVVRTQIQPHGN